VRGREIYDIYIFLDNLNPDSRLNCHHKHKITIHILPLFSFTREDAAGNGPSFEGEDYSYFRDLDRIAYISFQLLTALNYVHSLGLIHADVKPENILMKSYSDGEVKLIDFGSACFKTDHLSSYVQSRSYRAPEVILGSEYDGRIDIWSLGCVLAEVYNDGHVLFENDSLVQLLAAITAVCGNIPARLLATSKHAEDFFLKSGLLYEQKAEVGDGEEPIYALYAIKKRSLPEAMGIGIEGQCSDDEALFVDFLR